MTRRAITNVIKVRLADYPLPKAWPNQHFDPSAAGNLPYLSISILRTGTADETVDGSGEVQIGRIIVTVVTQEGSSDGFADDHADAVAALFVKGDLLTADAFTVEITGPPHIREGIPDDAYWRTPVIIPFRAL